ncbi:Imm43 family immunity protein [Pseudomonas syringae]|uniref:Immunity protein 43 domain-containing protein n=2 Tax=Pseudomonas syringae group TaxID=136849 RepID=A0A9Q4A6F2_PSESX|nr:DUF1629 domain-containing protein [Pseudomonas syringae]KTB71974.1 hypothetical protein AO067_05135 [Pseudomonas viridiflava ICMP 13104]KTB79683.1 hypothetical protein AO070_20205 [Pseudomonas syringae pv. syringae PD2766]MCF5470548.1 hypothetical protein [Pseudomonas syringae]MCF5475907.1 hypothetical protein [Pseudomonas syringae]MCF5485944.1 hypothetical protein [Pseudomonas syringae]
MHYTLAYRKDKNCPIFIDGVIHEAFSTGAYNRGMSQDWHYADPGEPKAKLPESLVLITKDKRYEFDLRTSFEGHIVSERFWSALKTLNIGSWEVAKLDIVSPKGVPMEQGGYYFIRQQMSELVSAGVIDLDKSSITYRKTGEIKSIESLILTSEATLDFFEIDETTLLDIVFLSPAAAELVNQLNLKGVEIVSTEKLGAIKPA